jgi:hypothetical protein
MPDPNTPKIQPANAEAAGIPFQPIAYADPQKAPNGIDVILTLPGKIEPEGMINLPKGCMLVAFPPEVAQAIIRGLKIQQPEPGSGQVRAPGIPN